MSGHGKREMGDDHNAARFRGFLRKAAPMCVPGRPAGGGGGYPSAAAASACSEPGSAARSNLRVPGASRAVHPGLGAAAGARALHPPAGPGGEMRDPVPNSRELQHPSHLRSTPPGTRTNRNLPLLKISPWPPAAAVPALAGSGAQTFHLFQVISFSFSNEKQLRTFKDASVKNGWVDCLLVKGCQLTFNPPITLPKEIIMVVIVIISSY